MNSANECYNSRQALCLAKHGVSWNVYSVVNRDMGVRIGFVVVRVPARARPLHGGRQITNHARYDAQRCDIYARAPRPNLITSRAVT